MKTSKSIVISLMLVLLVSASAMAQSGSKVIAVVNKASWCPVCQKNGKRAMSVLMRNNQDGAVRFVFNNLSNKQTKQKSAETLKKLDLYKTMSKFKSTGVVYFFDAKNKSLISHISLARSNKKLAEALTNSEKMAK
jgi:thiol-disulfide isomerase/thioredoxin